MRHALKFPVFVCVWFALSLATAQAASTRVIKVLPTLLDLKGRHALSPSLYDRDAYQAYLRKRPEEVSGVRFDVKWKAKTSKDIDLTLRVEVRGGGAQGKIPSQTTFEKKVNASPYSHWTSLSLTGGEYKKLGDLTAWRVSVWDGEQLLGEQKSFLW